MKNNPIIALLIVCFFTASCGNSETGKSEVKTADSSNTHQNTRDYAIQDSLALDMNYLIPNGTFTADIMRVGFSQKYKDISLRLKNNADKDEEWFKQHYAKSKKLGKMFYDVRLGITEEEFNYLNNYKGEFSKIGDVEITATREGQMINLTSNKIPTISTISFAVQDYYATLANVRCKYEGTFELADETYLGGAKKGHFWDYKFTGKEGATQDYQLKLSELKKTGQVMLYIGIADNTVNPPKQEEYILIYPGSLVQ